ncbi:hypothetical protein THAOC_03325, partial [Thalassiosira oceanica]
MLTAVDSHYTLDNLTLALTVVEGSQAGLQNIYDTLGFFKDTDVGIMKYTSRTADKRFPTGDNKFTGKTGNYKSDPDLKDRYKTDDDGNIVKKIDGDGKEVQNIETVDKMEKNSKGGGIEVEIFQEPNPRYVECYERQKTRQKREELRKKWKEDLWKWRMLVVRGLLFVANLAVEAMSLIVGQKSLSPNEEYNDSYYTKSTWTNLEAAIPWMTQSLQTINTNLASGIDQGTSHIADKIGTPKDARAIRSLGESGISYPKDTLHSRLEYIEDFLVVISNDIDRLEYIEAVLVSKSNIGVTNQKA